MYPGVTGSTGPSNSAAASAMTSSRDVHGGMWVSSRRDTPAAAASRPASARAAACRGEFQRHEAAEPADAGDEHGGGFQLSLALLADAGHPHLPFIDGAFFLGSCGVHDLGKSAGLASCGYFHPRDHIATGPGGPF